MKADLELLFQNKPIIKTIEEMIVFPDLHTRSKPYLESTPLFRVCNLFSA